MSRQRRKRTVIPVLDATVRASLWYFAWSVPVAAALLLKPLIALAVMIAHAAAFLSYQRLGRRRWRRRRAATLRLRSIRPTAARLAAALPPLLLGSLVLQLVQWRFSGAAPPASPGYAFAALPLGGLVVPCYAIVGAPLLEEFAFRGHLQGRVGRRLGQPVAAAVGAAAFAAIHVNAAWLLYYFVTGMLLAHVLVATRSIWGAVITHAALNAFFTYLNGGPAPWLFAQARAIPTVALVTATLLLLITAVGALAVGSRARRYAGAGSTSSRLAAPVNAVGTAGTAGRNGATPGTPCRSA